MIAFAFGFFPDNLLHGQPEFKTGAHPGNISHFAAENFPRQLLAPFAGGDGDDRIRVHVVHVLRPG